MSQVDLAFRTGVSLPTIQNIEAGTANPSIAILKKIVNCFGYEITITPSEPDWKKLIALGLPMQMDFQTGR